MEDEMLLSLICNTFLQLHNVETYTHMYLYVYVYIKYL